ncbi:hypothetical protein GCM10010431_61540 [Streptomyces kunmingensis]
MREPQRKRMTDRGGGHRPVGSPGAGWSSPGTWVVREVAATAGGTVSGALAAPRKTEASGMLRVPRMLAAPHGLAALCVLGASRMLVAPRSLAAPFAGRQS